MKIIRLLNYAATLGNDFEKQSSDVIKDAVKNDLPGKLTNILAGKRAANTKKKHIDGMADVKTEL